MSARARLKQGSIIALIAVGACLHVDAQTYLPEYTNSQLVYRDIDQSKEVGTVAGEAGVSDMGSATYTVPIEVAPGTAGMEPSLALTYDSRSGNGLLGRGFHLAGLSSITRVTRDFYHDGEVGPIVFGPEDRFAFDGQRLICTSGTYGQPGSTYDTEQTSFASITLLSNGGGNEVYYYFVVITKGGMTMEYGFDYNAKVLNSAGTAVFVWRMNRILDPFTNYIDYVYSGNSGDSWLDEIRYTGNLTTSMPAYNHIYFTYQDRDDPNKHFMPGASLEQTKLLMQIAVHAEGALVRRYDMTYSWRNERGSYLNDITETGEDGTSSYNPTMFAFGPENRDIDEEELYEEEGTDVDIFTGDFDGNGKSDRLIAHAANLNGLRYHTSFDVYLNNSGASTYSYQFPSIGEVQVFQVHRRGAFALRKEQIAMEVQVKESSELGFTSNDMNGDGRDDILLAMVDFNWGVFPDNSPPEWANGGIGAWEFQSFKVFMSTSTIGNANFDTPVDYAPPTTEKYFKQPRNFMQLGDFNGDGKQDAVCVFNDLDNPAGAYGWLFSGGAWTQLDISATMNQLNHADLMVSSDYNGDGKSDLTVFSDYSTVSEFFAIHIDGSNATQFINWGSFRQFDEDDYQVFPGDFNGDQITDYLVRDDDGQDLGSEDDWYIYTGRGGAEYVFPNPSGFVAERFSWLYEVDLDLHKVVVADFDGNGMSDILHHYFDEDIKNQLYYSYGHDGQTPLFDAPAYYEGTHHMGNLTVGDYDGNGKHEIISYNGAFTPLVVTAFDPASRERSLLSVSNGFCSLAGFGYANLSGVYHYVHGEDYQYPLNTAQMPIEVAIGVSTSDGTGGARSTWVWYEQARVHRTGKGFLGFAKVTRESVEMNTDVERVREFNAPYYLPLVVDEVVRAHADQAMLSESHFTYAVTAVGNAADMRCYPKLMQTESTAGLSGAETTVDNVWDAHGNVVVETTQGNTVETVRTKTYVNHGPGTVPNKVTWDYLTSTRDGEPTVERVDGATYAAQTGAMIERTAFLGTSGAVVTKFTHNDHGNVTEEIKSYTGLPAIDHRVVQFEYEPKNRFVSKRTRKWNNNGSIVPVVEEFATDPRWGVPLEYKSTDGLTSRHRYDPFGREIAFVVPHIAGAERYTVVTDLAWSLQAGTHEHYRSRIEHPGKPTREEFFDALGRSVRKRYEVNQIDEWTEVDMAYDAQGRLYYTTQPHMVGETFFSVTKAYDQYNRLETEENDVYGITTHAYAYMNDGSIAETVVPPSGQARTTTVDATGAVLTSVDNGGELENAYDSWGNLRRVRLNGSTATRMEYDEYGRQVELWDANNGSSYYVYDPFGQLIEQTDPGGNGTTVAYDNLGRTVNRSEAEGTTEWTYFIDGPRVNNSPVAITGVGTTVLFEYDDPYLRLTKKSKDIEGVVFDTEFSYDDYDNVTTITYPSGVAIDYSFTDIGTMDQVQYNGQQLFGNGVMNGLGQYVEYNQGGPFDMTKEYSYGRPTRYAVDGVQDLRMTWDASTGNLRSRWDQLKGRKETFDYDALNRLTGSVVEEVDANGDPVAFVEDCALGYDGSVGQTKGNLTEKSDVGQFKYAANKVTGAFNIAYPTPPDLPPDVINYLETQDVEYTSYHQPSLITEVVGGVTNLLNYTYGPDHHRSRSMLEVDGVLEETRWYVGGYEKQEKVSEGVTREIHYVPAKDGLCAVLVTEGGTTTVQHVFKDHLDSIVTTTESNGGLYTITAEQSFDAWGRDRDPLTWASSTTTERPSWLYRGFTGHEHVRPFELINMNGRMHDPLNGRMLSADNYVQGSNSTQGLNRYSYALNNPLKYTDPSGENIISELHNALEYVLHVVVRPEIHNGTDQKGIGLTVSIGQPKTHASSYRFEFGATYYFKNYGGTSGWETRTGGEITYFGAHSVTNTRYSSGQTSQTTSMYTMGVPFANAKTENDWFPLSDLAIFGVYSYITPARDNGDRYRTAAVEIQFGSQSAGFNLMTGDPGLGKRDYFEDPDTEGTETYGGGPSDPDSHRAGVVWRGFGDVKIGWNSEQARHRIQNEFAHDQLLQGQGAGDKGAKWFKVLDSDPSLYLYWGTGSNTLW